jgi:hypothetical protein
MWWKKPSVIFIIFFSILAIGMKIWLPHTNFISYDTFGLYMPLPAKYIYNDVGLETEWYKVINEKYQNTPTYFQIAQSPKGGLIMRFYQGMSYLWTPAFFAGHFYAKAFGYPADGFSMPYARALIIFGALFSILGFLLARMVLKHFFNETVTTLTLILVLAGTNLFFFSTIGNDVPHVYLFTLFLAVIWFTIKWHDAPKYSYMLLLGILLGLIVAIRPSDVFIAIFPALWGVYSKETLSNKIKLLLNHKLQIIIAAVLAFLIILPQLLYYYKYAGEFFVNIYDDAGASFNLTSPRIGQVLFGFRKGWFIYSPLSILGFVGLIFVYKRYREYFWPVTIYLALVIYMIASFNSLVSYGWRAFVQSYATLIIPTGFFVAYVIEQKVWAKVALGLVLIPFIVLNAHQAYQVKMEIIHGSRMTKEYYFAVLGKNRISDSDRTLLLIERSEAKFDEIHDPAKFKQSELIHLSFDDSQIHDSISPEPFRGTGIFTLDENTIYSPDLKIPYKDITRDYYAYIKTTVQVFSYVDIQDDLFIVTTTMNKRGEHIKYRTVTSGEAGNVFIPGQWNKMELNYQTPEIYTGNEIIQSFIWNRGQKKVWIDDFTVTAFTLD